MSKQNSSSHKIQDQDTESGADAPRQDASDVAAGRGGELPQPDAEVIVGELQQAQAQAQDYWEQLLRTRAELENLHRRSKKDLESAHKYALEKFVAELLPVQDSLELGVSAARDDTVDVAKLREGMALTSELLKALLEKFNIIEINPLGDKFNPELHQAMATREERGVAPGTVLTVYQKGYTLNDRLLRPALVVVSALGGGDAGESHDVDKSA